MPMHAGVARGTLLVATFLSGTALLFAGIQHLQNEEVRSSLVKSAPEDGHLVGPESYPSDFQEVVDDLIADCPQLDPSSAAQSIDAQSDAMILTQNLMTDFSTTFAGWAPDPCRDRGRMFATDEATAVEISNRANALDLEVDVFVVRYSYAFLEAGVQQVHAGQFPELGQAMAEVDAATNSVLVRTSDHVDPAELPTWMRISDEPLVLRDYVPE